MVVKAIIASDPSVSLSYADCKVADDEPAEQVITLLDPSIHKVVPELEDSPDITNVESESVVNVMSDVEVGEKAAAPSKRKLPESENVANTVPAS